MATSATGSTTTNLGALSSLTQGQATAKAPVKQLGKDEFLQLLVTQLKNQDPLEPMKNEEFAVNLAQFSQLEQLVSINQKIGTESTGDLSSMASYLGRQVTLSTTKLDVTGGKADSLSVDMTQDATAMQLNLLDANGKIVESNQLGPVPKGAQTLNISGLNAANGEYSYQLVATATNGQTFKPTGKISGIVSGFRPGPTPTLLIGNREVSPGDITEVTIPK